MFEQYNFEKTKKHFEAFWNKDYLERCNLSITLNNHQSDYKSPYSGQVASTEQSYTDCDYVYHRCLEATKNSIYMAEAFPVFYTNFGTAGHCAYFGCEPNYKRDTIWFEPILDEPDAKLIKYNNKHYDFQRHFMAELSKKSMGQFMVGMNDNCGNVDALAEIRGTDNLLMDLITDPDFVKEAIKKVTDVWKETQTEFFKTIKENNGGGSSHGWMNTWSEGTHAQIQCDFSVMISAVFFEEFVLPELDETARYLGKASYHLDGQEQLRHLDYILSVKNIENIQWTAVAGQPPTSHFVEAFQKIQKAGKGLILIPDPSETKYLLDNLSHKGLHLVLNGIETVEDAQDIIDYAVKVAH